MDVRLAAEQFSDAVHALIGGTWNGNRYIDSVYARLRESLTATTAKTGAGSKSRLPCRVDVLALLCGIDTRIAVWWPDATGTIDKLAKMVEHRWTPDQVDTLQDHTHQLKQFVVAGRELLGDNPINVAIRKPCPRCRNLWAYRNTGGETIRTYALTVSETGAACTACHSTWPPEKFGLLTRLLEAANA